MHQIIAFPLAQLCFRSRRGETGPSLSLGASLRRWRRRTSLPAIARAFSDTSFNPYLFQLE